MKNIQFQVDGYLEGGFPLEEEDIETITELAYYDQLIDLIENGNFEEVINLVNEKLDAEFIVENIAPLEDEGFEFLDVKNQRRSLARYDRRKKVQVPQEMLSGEKMNHLTDGLTASNVKSKVGNTLSE